MNFNQTTVHIKFNTVHGGKTCVVCCIFLQQLTVWMDIWYDFTLILLKGEKYTEGYSFKSLLPRAVFSKFSQYKLKLIDYGR